MLKLVKVISKKTYINDNDEEKPIIYYSLEFDNGKRVPIKPMFNEGFSILKFNADKVFDLRKENKNNEE